MIKCKKTEMGYVMPQNKKFLNSNMIKLIAITAMTADHLAWAIFPGYSKEPVAVILHIIGRLTCPIMCYCIAEGFHYTRNIKKYTARLFIFAFISHFAYMFFSGGYNDPLMFIPFASGSVFNQTSVMWSLAWGLVMLRTVYSDKIKSMPAKVILIILICIISFPSDWSCIAAMFVLSFGTNRLNIKNQAKWLTVYAVAYSAVYIAFLDPIYGLIQMGVLLSLPIINCYNSQRGKSAKFNKFMKWFFYIYYPAHLIVIGLIAQYI